MPLKPESNSAANSNSAQDAAIDQEYQMKEKEILRQIHETQISLYERLLLNRFEKMNRKCGGTKNPIS